VSSFDASQQFYLFAMLSGGKKLSYGKDAADAYEVLSLRLSSEEMADVDPNEWIKIHQRQIQEYVHLLR
jgi:hypothetical protein